MGSTKPLKESVPALWVQLPWSQFDCLPLSSAEVKNEWSYTFIHPIRLHSVHSDVFTFILSSVLSWVNLLNFLRILQIKYKKQ